MISRASDDSSLPSAVESLSISDTSTSQRPLPRANNPRIVSKRDSRALYSGAPGHTSPGWNRSTHLIQDPSLEDDDSDDDQPLSSANVHRPSSIHSQSLMHSSPSFSSSFSRPMSVRNLAMYADSPRPARFMKPANQPSKSTAPVPSDMTGIQKLFETYHQKVYTEGYLFKLNELNTDGKPCANRKWTRCYIELCGPVLTFWEAEQEESVQMALPQYINIMDAKVEYVEDGVMHDQSPQQNIFALNSAGANRYLFQAADDEMRSMWIRAIRLSSFECSRLQEMYTRQLIVRSSFSDILKKRGSKVEGFLQVRSTGATEWQKYWAVVSDKSEKKKLFGKKSIPSRGQLLLFPSKKAKDPIMKILNVVQAYTIYPESPQLINAAVLLKVEGTVYLNGDQNTTPSASSALLMAATPDELIQWLIGIFDAFKLYGRPSRLLDDPNHINALNFGEPVFGEQPRLFLELADVAQVETRDTTLLDNKATFAGILAHKLRTQQTAPLLPPTPNLTNGRTNSMPLLSNALPSHADMPRKNSAASAQILSTNRMSMMSSSNQLQRPASFAMARPPHSRSKQIIYASDDSEDEEEDDDDEDDDNDDSENESDSADYDNVSSIFKRQLPVSKSEASLPTHHQNGATPSHLPQLVSPHSKTSTGSSQTSLSGTDSKVNHSLGLPQIGGSDDFAQSIFGDMPAFHDAQSKEKSIQPVPSPLSMQQARDSTSSVASDRLSHTVDIPKSAEPPVNAVKPGAYAPNRGPRNVPSNQVAASASGDSRSSIQSMTPSDSDNSLPGTRFRNPTAAVGRPARSVASVNLSSPAPPMGHRWTPAPLSSRPSGAASVNGDFDRRSIYPQHQQQWDTASVDPRMMMGGAAAPFFGYYNDPHNVYDGSVYGGDDGYMDGAGMSHLGEPHLTHNSLLDNYRREHLPVHSQEELARASGQPLVQLPNKPPQPKAGLIGVISQLEHEKKEKEASKGRTMDMEREHMLEQERIMFEQRQQMMQQQQAMMGANPYMMNMMGYGMGMNMGMPVMDPRFAMMGSMPMMDPRMPMMNGMNMVGMPMMDPRMSMMGMPAANNMYGQLPMYPPTNGLWNNFQRFNGGIQEEVEDEDDNAPLGKPAGFGSPHMEADKRLSNAYYQRQRQRTNNS